MARWRELPVVNDSGTGGDKVETASVDLDELSFYSPIEYPGNLMRTLVKFKGGDRAYLTIDMNYEAFHRLMHQDAVVGAILS